MLSNMVEGTLARSLVLILLSCIRTLAQSYDYLYDIQIAEGCKYPGDRGEDV